MSEQIPVDSVTSNPYQPRQKFDEDDLQDTANTIKEYGLVHAIEVKPPNGDGTYELVSGERRLRAAKLAGCETIKAEIEDVDDETQRAKALIENIHRVGLTGVEKGTGLLGHLIENGVKPDLNPEQLAGLNTDDEEIRKAVREFASDVHNDYQHVEGKDTRKDADYAARITHKELDKIGVGGRSARKWLRNASLADSVKTQEVTPQESEVGSEKASVIAGLDKETDQQQVHTSTDKQDIPKSSVDSIVDVINSGAIGDGVADRLLTPQTDDKGERRTWKQRGLSKTKVNLLQNFDEEGTQNQVLDVIENTELTDDAAEEFVGVVEQTDGQFQEQVLNMDTPNKQDVELASAISEELDGRSDDIQALMLDVLSKSDIKDRTQEDVLNAFASETIESGFIEAICSNIQSVDIGADEGVDERADEDSERRTTSREYWFEIATAVVQAFDELDAVVPTDRQIEVCEISAERGMSKTDAKKFANSVPKLSDDQYSLATDELLEYDAEAIAHLARTTSESGLESAEELQGFVDRMQDVRDRREEVRDDPAVQERRELLINWMHHVTAQGLLDDEFQCPDCGSGHDYFGWQCCEVSISEALDSAREQYHQSATEVESDETFTMGESGISCEGTEGAEASETETDGGIDVHEEGGGGE